MISSSLFPTPGDPKKRVQPASVKGKPPAIQVPPPPPVPSYKGKPPDPGIMMPKLGPVPPGPSGQTYPIDRAVGPPAPYEPRFSYAPERPVEGPKGKLNAARGFTPEVLPPPGAPSRRAIITQGRSTAPPNAAGMVETAGQPALTPPSEPNFRLPDRPIGQLPKPAPVPGQLTNVRPTGVEPAPPVIDTTGRLVTPPGGLPAPGAQAGLPAPGPQQPAIPLRAPAVPTSPSLPGGAAALGGASPAPLPRVPAPAPGTALGGGPGQQGFMAGKPPGLPHGLTQGAPGQQGFMAPAQPGRGIWDALNAPYTPPAAPGVPATGGQAFEALTGMPAPPTMRPNPGQPFHDALHGTAVPRLPNATGPQAYEALTGQPAPFHVPNGPVIKINTGGVEPVPLTGPAIKINTGPRTTAFPTTRPGATPVPGATPAPAATPTPAPAVTPAPAPAAAPKATKAAPKATKVSPMAAKLTAATTPAATPTVAPTVTPTAVPTATTVTGTPTGRGAVPRFGPVGVSGTPGGPSGLGARPSTSPRTSSATPPPRVGPPAGGHVAAALSQPGTLTGDQAMAGLFPQAPPAPPPPIPTPTGTQYVRQGVGAAARAVGGAGGAANRAAGRVISQAPTRLKNALTGGVGAAGLAFQADPRGTAALAGQARRGEFSDIGHGMVQGFKDQSDYLFNGRGHDDLAAAMQFAGEASGDQAADRFVSNVPIVGQLYGAVKNVAQGVNNQRNNFAQHGLAGGLREGWDQVQRGAGVLAGDFAGPGQAEGPAPAPDANPNHLTPENLAQVQGQGLNPLHYSEDARGNLGRAPGSPPLAIGAPGPGPAPTVPAESVGPAEGESTADANARFASQYRKDNPVLTAYAHPEAAISASGWPAPAPGAAPATRAPAPTVAGRGPSPKAPGGTTTYRGGGKIERTAYQSPGGQAQGQQAAGNDPVLAGMMRSYQDLVQGGPVGYGDSMGDLRQQHRAQVAAMGKQISDYQSARAQDTEAGAHANAYNEQARPVEDRMAAINRSPGARATHRVENRVDPAHIPAYEQDAARANQASSDSGSPEIDASNWQQELMNNKYYENLRPHLLPQASGAANPLESIIDNVSQFPGATFNPQVMAMIQHAVRAQYPGPALEEARRGLAPGFFNSIFGGDKGWGAKRQNYGAQMGLWNAQ